MCDTKISCKYNIFLEILVSLLKFYKVKYYNNNL